MRTRRNPGVDLTNKFILVLVTKDNQILRVPMSADTQNHATTHIENYDIAYLSKLQQLNSKGDVIAEFPKINVSVRRISVLEHADLVSLSERKVYLNAIEHTGYGDMIHYQVEVVIKTKVLMFPDYDWLPDRGMDIFWVSNTRYEEPYTLFLLGGTEFPAISKDVLSDVKIPTESVKMREVKIEGDYYREFYANLLITGVNCYFYKLVCMSAHRYFDSVNVKGNWIHVLNQNLILAENEIKNLQGEICVSFPSDPSLYAHRDDFIGLLFTGTVSYLYKGDCWSSVLPTGEGKYRVPSEENEGEPLRHEGFLDPRKAKFEGFVVGGERAYEHIHALYPKAVIHLLRKSDLSALRVLCWLPEFKEMKKCGIIITPSRKETNSAHAYGDAITYLVKWDNKNPVHQGFIEDIPDHCVLGDDLWILKELRSGVY